MCDTGEFVMAMLHGKQGFLAPLAIGQRASLCHGLLSVVHPSVLALTFSLNILSETTYRILIKFYRNVPAMVLFRIS